METFRDILCRQIETLQGYFDACAEASSSFKHTAGEWVHSLCFWPPCITDSEGMHLCLRVPGLQTLIFSH